MVVLQEFEFADASLSELICVVKTERNGEFKLRVASLPKSEFASLGRFQTSCRGKVELMGALIVKWVQLSQSVLGVLR